MSEAKALSPGRLAWRRLRRNKIAMTGASLLILLYLVAIFAGFFSPYSPTTDEFRGYFFHPPTRLVFKDIHGTFHFRPRIAKTHLVDQEQLLYASGTPLYLEFHYPAANFSPYVPELIEGTDPVLEIKTAEGKRLAEVRNLRETAPNSAVFSALTAIDADHIGNSPNLIVETITGESVAIPVLKERPAPLASAPETNIRLKDTQGNYLAGYFPEIRYSPVKFFVRGWKYEILWLFESNIHLFGVDSPGHIFLFGTDQSGRDVFSRVLFGAQISLTVGLFGVLITTVFGMLIGGIAGYYGGKLDETLMRFAEILMSIPALYLILTLRNLIPDRMQESYEKLEEIAAETFAWQQKPLALILVGLIVILFFTYYNYRRQWSRFSLILSGSLASFILFGKFYMAFFLGILKKVVPPSTHLTSQWVYLMIILILSLVTWAAMSRIIRGMVLSLREQDYVQAARALGASDLRIIVRHILPNTFGYVIVRATLLIPAYILGEVALSYLAVGVQEPIPSWGNMLSAAQNLRVLQQFTWTIVPGFFIFITVLAYNFFGDGLRDAFDPKQR